ncbi:hypothetical protein DOK78_002383 [Enterococcus sp. DIV2402]|uniref:Uncharacterized protein n=1 Tax=Candidatus Enterococcus lowellii TaxID=2230877 RepID=A0ABZ2SPN2_9ENTE|nr:hypothetical protein [Enterococcus sp. DIV2402]MBO0463497.1 hypothetical protein [Enterococcus sp. DIV2402]
MKNAMTANNQSNLITGEVLSVFSYDALNDLARELYANEAITSKAITLCQSVTVTETDTRLLRMLCQKFKEETLGKSAVAISDHILRVLDFLGTARTAHWLMFSASVLDEPLFSLGE